MRRFELVVLLAGFWGSAACGQTDKSAVGKRGDAVDLARGETTTRLNGDPLVREADSLVRIGRPWRASATLAPRLRTPATATPEARLAGARAAAAWQGWSEVDRILQGATWLDTAFGGEARELITRGHLERDQDAVADARRALAAARNDAARVVRQVLLARAYDRANQTDSAAANYAAAADRLPRVSDWLQLRAAGVLADSAARAAHFAQLDNPAARARVRATDAQARERTGDFNGAARVYQETGAIGDSFRAAALAARDAGAKRALATGILAYLGGNPAAGEVRQAIATLDKLSVPLARDQELVVARASANRGSASRAVQSFDNAAAGGSLAAADGYAYAGALLAAGRAADAVSQFAAVSGDAVLVARASYQRARALLSAGNGSAARSALRSTTDMHSGVAAAAAPALLLLADLQIDDGDVSGAAASLARVRSRYPTSSQAPTAYLRGGLIAWSRSPSTAAALFDSLVQRYPGDDDAIAARYWAGRAHQVTGKSAEAQAHWRAVIAASPLSYYAGLSAARLHVPGWSPPAGPDSAPRRAAVDSAIARVMVLQQLGMDVESRLELDALADRAKRQPTLASAIADGMLRAGEPARALRVATRAIQQQAPTRALLNAAYPVVHPGALAEQSRRNGLDAALVAGLIRQESSWNPHALSPVGARGLMQLMPDVGAAVARSHNYPVWNTALLYEPAVSLELGTAHLASSLPRGTPPARALAAYNAGASRVNRWSRRPGVSDPELFTEWIPFTETRDYVRIVQRNAEVYRALHGLR